MERISPYLLTFVFNAAWQIPLIACAASLACRFMRTRPAQHRHAIWVAALFAAILVPAASVWKSNPPRETFSVPTQAAPIATAAPVRSTPPFVAQAAPEQRYVPVGKSTAKAVFGIYLMMLICAAGRLVWGWMQSERIRKGSVVAFTSNAVTAIWERCVNAFDVDGVRLLNSNAASGPLTAGRDVIMPTALLSTADEAVLATAFGHELAHVARLDFWLNIGYELLGLPIFFHPATAWIRREIARTRELACDELVTERLVSPRDYAKSIVSIAGTMSGMAETGCTLGVLDGDILEERVHRLIHEPSANRKRARLVLVSAMTGLAICVVTATGLAISARAQSAAQPEMKAAATAISSGDFSGAADHFRRAVALDPENLKARLWLAFALVREFGAQAQDRASFESRVKVATGESSENNPLLLEAYAQYEEILRRDPTNEGAIFGLSSAGGPIQAKQARELMQKLIAEYPMNRDAHYALGAIDWRLAYPPIRQAQTAARISRDTYHIPDPEVRRKLRVDWMPTIDEGLQALTTALQLQPNRSDAMAYFNLLERAKAAIVDADSESSALIQDADSWVRRAIAAGRSMPPGGLQTFDVDAPLPPLAIPAPPPPPPPPPGWVRGEPAHPGR